MSESAQRLPRWSTLVALNLVSGLAQLGQFGIAFALIPLALQARGLPAWQIGGASALLWSGMAGGLVLAPGMILRLGNRRTVLVGLTWSALCLALMPWLETTYWALAGFLLGGGIGLRWIGNETWLYHLTPPAMRGRVVGVHETIIGLASTLGPGLVAAVGVRHWHCFALAAGFTCSAALPLMGLRALQSKLPSPAPAPSGGRAAPRHQGALVAGCGGLMEAALLALLPVYAAGQGFSSKQTALLLLASGLGATLLQFPIGWCAERWGWRNTALACACLSAVGALLLPLSAVGAGRPLAALLFLLSGTLAGFLTLGLIAATRDGDLLGMARDLRRVSLVFASLSGLGPLVGGVLMSAWGNQGLVGLMSGVALGLAAWLVFWAPGARAEGPEIDGC